jgi:phytoene/squalene synthetase
VGRILLELYKKHEQHNLIHSDNICTALQLINFYQDVAIDYAKNRFYLSYDILYEHNFSMDNLKDLCEFSKNNNPKKHNSWLEWQQMMYNQVHIAQQMLLSGLPLCKNLPKRMGLELKCMIYAANTICNKLHKINYNVFTKRPVLKWYDWITILATTIIK